MRSENCRHCGKLFIPQPIKSGFIDECPQCVEERQTEAAATAESEKTVDLLNESVRTSRFVPKTHQIPTNNPCAQTLVSHPQPSTGN